MHTTEMIKVWLMTYDLFSSAYTQNAASAQWVWNSPTVWISIFLFYVLVLSLQNCMEFHWRVPMYVDVIFTKESKK